MQDTHKCKPARHQKHHHLVLIHLPKIHLTEIKAIIIFIFRDISYTAITFFNTFYSSVTVNLVSCHSHMSGFIITMMMHLFKRLHKDVYVFYSKTLYCSMSIWWELLEIIVRRKTGEGKRVLIQRKPGGFWVSWATTSRRKSLSLAVKPSKSHEEGDKTFP